MKTLTFDLTTNAKGRATVVRSSHTVSDGSPEDEEATYFVRGVFPIELDPEDVSSVEDDEDEEIYRPRFNPDTGYGEPLSAIREFTDDTLFASPKLIEVYASEEDVPDLAALPTTKDGKLLIHLVCAVEIPTSKFSDYGRSVSLKTAKQLIRSYSSNAISTFESWQAFNEGNTYCVIGGQNFLPDDYDAVSSALQALAREQLSEPAATVAL